MYVRRGCLINIYLIFIRPNKSLTLVVSLVKSCVSSLADKFSATELTLPLARSKLYGFTQHFFTDQVRYFSSP